jgi:hypothetical protein
VFSATAVSAPSRARFDALASARNNALRLNDAANRALPLACFHLRWAQRKYVNAENCVWFPTE